MFVGWSVSLPDIANLEQPPRNANFKMLMNVNVTRFVVLDCYIFENQRIVLI